MAWEVLRTWVASEVITRQIMVGDLRDNSFELEPHKVTTKGDLIVGSALNVVTRFGVGTNTQLVLADSAQTLGIKWAMNPIDDQFVAKGDLLVGSTVDVGTILPVIGGNGGEVLVADSRYPLGLQWAGSPAIISNMILADCLLGRL